MNREDRVLAAMAATESGELDPVQIQKLMFLIEKNIGNQLGGEGFTFQPYHYGPFDPGVYVALERLSQHGLVAINYGGQVRTYQITGEGRRKGQVMLADLPQPISGYLFQLATYVKGLTFSQLVSAIYKAYPEMKANSVFRE